MTTSKLGTRKGMDRTYPDTLESHSLAILGDDEGLGGKSIVKNSAVLEDLEILSAGVCHLSDQLEILH